MHDEFGNDVRPVFLLGVTQRTGTHLLDALLALHPECCFVGPRPVHDYWTFEDHVLQDADLLERYVTGTRRRWAPPWHGDRTVDGELLEGIGAGLFRGFTALGKPATGSIALLRTPSVQNLALVPKLFPEAQVIVVVRHPLAVAASGARSFGSAFRSSWPDQQTWLQQWRVGVRGLLAAYEELGGRRLLSVRFEDLVEKREMAVRMMLGFLDLDPDAYDFDAAAQIAVRGSSEQRHTKVNVDWQPSTAAAGFDPVQRGNGLPERQRRRLAAIAAPELRMLGYDPGVEVRMSDRVVAAASTRGLRLEQRILDGARPVWRRLRGTG